MEGWLGCRSQSLRLVVVRHFSLSFTLLPFLLSFPQLSDVVSLFCAGGAPVLPGSPPASEAADPELSATAGVDVSRKFTRYLHPFRRLIESWVCSLHQ